MVRVTNNLLIITWSCDLKIKKAHHVHKRGKINHEGEDNAVLLHCLVHSKLDIGHHRSRLLRTLPLRSGVQDKEGEW